VPFASIPGPIRGFLPLTFEEMEDGSIAPTFGLRNFVVFVVQLGTCGHASG